ncbi:MAG TPA: hypothetical protein VGF12_06175, partial [Roseateles sp.]|uniref:hypothetical protein n=1 Tax=Roseateles sp. TaxID=1971397 RepID=UPI002EDAB436
MNTSAAALPPKKKRRAWKLLLLIIGGLLLLLLTLITTVALVSPIREWTATQILTESVVRERLADVPPRTQALPVEKTMVRMRDGVELSTQVFLPQGAGPWPIIVVRDPYSFAHYTSCKVFV